MAFKVLYSLEYEEVDEKTGNLKLIELYPEKLREVMEDLDNKSDIRIKEFTDFLIKNTLLNVEEIDKKIIRYSQNWSLERLALTDKALLRMGIYEIIYTETPAAIVMDEIIEIAKRFCSESSSKFINGVLNAITNGKDRESE